MKTSLAPLLLLGLAACSLGEPGGLPETEVRAGLTGELPSVVEVRVSDACLGDLPMTIRFSQPMERANVEAGITLAEVRGDRLGSTLPVASPPAEIVAGSFRWEDGDRIVSFSAKVSLGLQYVLTLPNTVTNKAGLGLDGLVGEDLDKDGNADIQIASGNFARVDDDYLRAPAPFTSLPFFRCRAGGGAQAAASDNAPSVWRAPLHNVRPRVLEFAGVMPTSEQTPRYVPEAGYLPFSTADGITEVKAPLPAKGVLRIRAAAPNTAPTEPYARHYGSTPVLPSTLVGNFEVIDDELRDYKAEAFLDERLLVPAPLAGKIEAITAGNKFTSQALAGVPANALQGASLIVKGHDNLTYVLTVQGNSGTEVTLDPVYYRGPKVSRDAGALSSLHFHGGAFRENELRGFRIVGDGSFSSETLVAEGNTAAFVRIQSGTIACAALAGPICGYNVHIDLEAMEVLNQDFEIAPEFLYIKTANPRRDGQRFFLRLNIGDSPILDAYGNAFVDGTADGNDLAGVADDVWEGVFTSGDESLAPIPPRLQLNDGRYYSPFPNGPTHGATVDFGAAGLFTHLAHGIMGRYRLFCEGGEAHPRLHELGLLFATPDALQHTIGDNDLLNTATLTTDNFGLFRFTGGVFEPHSLEVASATVHVQIYTPQGSPIKRQAATLVLLSPSPANGTATQAGDDNLCGTADDRVVQATRPWQAGDRILISHRVQFTGSDENTLDGNYDGILDDNAADDMIFEYRPETPGLFVHILR